MSPLVVLVSCFCLEFNENLLLMRMMPISPIPSCWPVAKLGLMMMLRVARACRTTSITVVYEEIAAFDAKGVLTAKDELLMEDEFAGVVGGGGVG